MDNKESSVEIEKKQQMQKLKEKKKQLKLEKEGLIEPTNIKDLKYRIK